LSYVGRHLVAEPFEIPPEIHSAESVEPAFTAGSARKGFQSSRLKIFSLTDVALWHFG